MTLKDYAFTIEGQGGQLLKLGTYRAPNMKVAYNGVQNLAREYSYCLISVDLDTPDSTLAAYVRKVESGEKQAAITMTSSYLKDCPPLRDKTFLA